MLIILEGCDGTGKTTLAEKFKAKIPDAEIIHCTRETPNTYEYFRDIIKDSRGKAIILDRAMYGQFVYQEEADRPMTKEQLRMLENYMNLLSDVTIYWVTADKKVILSRLESRKEKLSLPYDTIEARFRAIFNESACKIISWDTTNNKEVPDV